MSLGLKSCAVLAVLVVFASLACGQDSVQWSTNDILTHAAQVISLPPEQAALNIKAVVTGTVTAADPALKGRFFLQDSTGGVFVDNANGQRPEPGDVVEVSGITTVGAYAPIITAPTVRKVGTATLPAAKRVPIERLMSGAEDSQRIEVSGILRAARVDGGRLVADMMSGGYRFRVYAPVPPDTDPQSLVAAQVRVRGTAAEAHNRSLRQLVSAEVYVPVLADFTVEAPESAKPFNEPVIPLNALAQYHRDNSLIQRVHTRGVVTLHRLGENLFLQDATGGLEVQTSQMMELSPGDVIDVVGFPTFENYLPVLQDAVFHKTSGLKATLQAKPASFEDIQSGLHHGDYVAMEGKVVDRTVRQMRRKSTGLPDTRTTLALQGTNFFFAAESDGPDARTALTSVPIGSTVSVRGVCLTEIDSDGRMQSFRILIADPSAVQIIRRPSWFTPGRLLAGFSGACFLLVVIVSWTVMLSKKNATLNYLIREREKAQIELQRAHDMLEERVKERTVQLKFQITARKESEVQFKAILGERTRLAQELHDTLEQTLTGIALQLDTAAKLFEKNPAGTLRHLELARNLMNQSQVEVRRSVWDLRSRALEQFDLPGALLRSARQMTVGTGIQVTLDTKGKIKPLPEVVEENLLRIGQEALTNVIKHSDATRAKIELEFGPQTVVLQIEDDGHGFKPENAVGPREGHFGLLGMSERAKRLSGHVVIKSAAGMGTMVRVELPVSPAQETQPTQSEEVSAET